MAGLALSDLLVLSAAGMFVLGYLIINQVILRLMLLIGTALYICYYAVVDASPLWPAIWASMATGTANLVGLMALIYGRSSWAVPKMYRDVYPHFKMLPPGDFRKLMKVAERTTRPAGYMLTEGGRPVSKLYYIIDGAVRLEKFGDSFDIPDAVFVGEVAYLTNRRASASTILTKESDVLEWDVGILQQRSRRDPRFRLAIDAVISLDLAGKVARAGSPIQRLESPVSPPREPEERSATAWTG